MFELKTNLYNINIFPFLFFHFRKNTNRFPFDRPHARFRRRSTTVPLSSLFVYFNSIERGSDRFNHSDSPPRLRGASSPFLYGHAFVIREGMTIAARRFIPAWGWFHGAPHPR